jgi:hypothetical protein
LLRSERVDHVAREVELRWDGPGEGFCVRHEAGIGGRGRRRPPGRTGVR